MATTPTKLTDAEAVIPQGGGRRLAQEISEALRQPIVLPDFARRQWVSVRARSVWEPRITAIGQQFAAAERLSVETGIRRAALQNISPDQLPELASRAARVGLVVTPLAMQGRPESYAASTVASGSGPMDYRVVLTTWRDAPAFVAAFERSDDEAMGELLGYPDCCRRYFAATWGAGSVDPTWEMVDHEPGPAEANILLRWLGVRYVPHMPCGFGCEGSAELGRKLRELIPELERAWMDELLGMPMLWSALHGIGEVITPIVSLNFRADVSHELREIRRDGKSYPEAGAHGLRFPYRPPPARRTDERLWTDNGFASLEAMESAHRVVTSVLPSASRSVLDLGCGNGMLARKLAGVDGKALGVELDDGRAERATRYLSDVVRCDLFDKHWGGWLPVDLVVLMPGRLVEKADASLVSRLRYVGRRLLVYAYGDWLDRYSSLEDLCHVAGLAGQLTEPAAGDGAAAGLWEWA